MTREPLVSRNEDELKVFWVPGDFSSRLAVEAVDGKYNGHLMIRGSFWHFLDEFCMEN